MKLYKKVVPMLLTGSMIAAMAMTTGAAEAQDLSKEEVEANIAATKVDKSTLPRILITTDLEVDDQNGMLLNMMYMTDYDLTGIVWTAGMFHFNGDGGEHTLAEITPNYKCEVTTLDGAVENAGQLTEFRPVEEGTLEHFCDLYEQDYPNLVANNPNYMTPEEFRSICKVGNIEFEGDYRYETEGSELIYDRIMDDDERELYIMHWGGINTTVRALYSIYEDYHDTDEWEAVLEKVVSKVRLVGSGEDNCRADSGIDEMFPGLQDSTWQSFGGYGNYWQAVLQGEYPVSFAGTNERLNPYYQGEYLTEAFKFDHGAILGEFHLMGDGQEIPNEPDFYQYGLTLTMDWQQAIEHGYGADSEFGRMFVAWTFDQYDWMCCQFGCVSYINLGLRQDISNSNDRYNEVLFEELAARADWAIMDVEEANHAPVVTTETTDYTAAAGEEVTITFDGEMSDPDGDALSTTWWLLASGTTYVGTVEEDAEEEGSSSGAAAGNIDAITMNAAEDGMSATVIIPDDAAAGDIIVVNLEVSDVDVERPMTRFVQYKIVVE